MGGKLSGFPFCFTFTNFIKVADKIVAFQFSDPTEFFEIAFPLTELGFETYEDFCVWYEGEEAADREPTITKEYEGFMNFTLKFDYYNMYGGKGYTLSEWIERRGCVIHYPHFSFKHVGDMDFVLCNALRLACQIPFDEYQKFESGAFFDLDNMTYTVYFDGDKDAAATQAAAVKTAEKFLGIDCSDMFKCVQCNDGTLVKIDLRDVKTADVDDVLKANPSPLDSIEQRGFNEAFLVKVRGAYKGSLVKNRLSHIHSGFNIFLNTLPQTFLSSNVSRTIIGGMFWEPKKTTEIFMLNGVFPDIRETPWVVEDNLIYGENSLLDELLVPNSENISSVDGGHHQWFLPVSLGCIKDVFKIVRDEIETFYDGELTCEIVDDFVVLQDIYTRELLP